MSRVTIAGKEYVLLFNHSALKVANERLRKPMDEVIPNDILARKGRLADLGENIVTELLACALLHVDKTASDKTADALITSDPRAYYDINLAIISAWWEMLQDRLPIEVIERMKAKQGGGTGEATAPPPDGDGASSKGGPTSEISSTSAGGTGSP